MIVCCCHAITDRQIRDAADQGATSCSAIARFCRAGSGCGGCRSTVQRLLDERAVHSLIEGPAATARA